MISLKCEDCLGTMDIDENREIISCPYCGSKKIIPISDAVRIEKIRQEARLKSEELDFKAERAKSKEDMKAILVGVGVMVILMTLLVLFFKAIGLI